MLEIRPVEIGKIYTPNSTIDVFHLDLDAGILHGELKDEYEHERYSRFATELLRHRYRQSHLAKREILAAYLHTEGYNLKFAQGDYGKPYIEGTPIHFSMSHTHGWGTIAVSICEIGTDCELGCDNDDLDMLASTIAHRDEKIVGTESFYRTWTRKEAVLKQLGHGLSLEPRRLRVPNEPVMNPHWMSTSIEGWTKSPSVADVQAPPGIFAAIAAQLQMPIRVFRLMP